MKKIIGINKININKKEIISNITSAILAITLGLIISSHFEISQVDGISMSPTFDDGDYIITLTGAEPKDGDIIIVNTENNKNFDCERIVKRYKAEKSDNSNIWVEGDNADVSLDSRVTGTLDRQDIVGIVVLDINKLFR